MTRRKKIAIALIALLLIGGVGTALAVQRHNENEKKEQAAAEEAAAKAERLAKAEREREAEEAALQAAIDDCHGLMDDLVQELTDLDSKISVGMVYADYTESVRDVSVAYGRIDIDELEPSCLKHVALDAEKAVNRYSQAAEVWGDAIEGGYPVSESQLQDKWASGSRLINHATDGFDDVKADEYF